MTDGPAEDRHAGRAPGPERSRDLERFITFIDAIVAIAITLLVLPLAELVNEIGDDQTAREVLSHHRPELWSFVLSFVVIARLWLIQHHLLSRVVEFDTWLTWLMLIWAFTIVVLPFPTSLLPAHGSERFTRLFYIGCLLMSGIVLALISDRLIRHPEYRSGGMAPRRSVAIASVVVLLAALLISEALPVVGYWALFLLYLVDPAADRWDAWRARHPHPAS